VFFVAFIERAFFNKRELLIEDFQEIIGNHSMKKFEYRIRNFSFLFDISSMVLNLNL